jgi:C4-dicarboxylate-specific signal transduction histidine kinase
MLSNPIALSHLAENVPGMIYRFYVNTQGQMGFEYASAKAFEIFEVSPDDFALNPNLFVEMVLDEDKPHLLKLIEESRVQNSSFEWEGRIKTKNNHIKWTWAKSTPEKKSDGSTYWDGVVMDVTEKRQTAIELEEINRQLKESQEMLKANQVQMIESARLASLGEMAGGVAHEVNNPLTVILICAEKLKKQIKDLENEIPTQHKNLIEQIDKIESTSQRISKIVSGLRAMSRNGSNDPFALASIGKIIEDSLSLCQQQAKNANIQIKIDSRHAQTQIMCRAVQLSQVFLNLFVNAFHALETSKDKFIEIKTELTDKMIKIEFSDSGDGIPEENRDKLFTPFFTTKKVGHGTGLGLSISRGIIQNHQGKLYLKKDSQQTTFVIELPMGEVSV